VRRAVLTGAVVCLLVPPAGDAAEVSLRASGPASYELVFAGGPEANAADIRRHADFPVVERVLVRDDGSDLAAGEHCRSTGPRSATCDPPPGAFVRGGSVLGEGGGDRVFSELRVPTLVAGGPGDDRLAAETATFVGGPGADLIEAHGRSELSYADRSAPVRATLDRTANDGEPGEGDDLRGSFDAITGGAGADELSAAPSGGELPRGTGGTRLNGAAGDDLLVGGDRPDELNGGDGRDVLLAEGGADRLWGGAGPDRMRGGAGDDVVSYVQPPSATGPQSTAGVLVTLNDQPDDGAEGEGDDVGADVESVHGGPGPDTLVGGTGEDSLQGREGDDVLMGGAGFDDLEGGPGADRIVGGAGSDRAVTGFDRLDTLELRDGEPDFGACEGRPRRLSADPFDFLLGCFSYAHFGEGELRLATPPAGGPSLTLRCRSVGGREGCRGEVRLVRRSTGKLLASARYRLLAGTRERVRLRLTAAGRKLRSRARAPIRVVALAVPQLMSDPTRALGATWPRAHGEWRPG
jgi:hypothetical protein